MAYGNLTEVRLLNVPLENDYIHTLHFNSLSNQTNYFLGKQVSGMVATELTYQRKDNIIRYPAQYDRLLGCNYVMYRNPAYNNKWWYAFITDIKYVDDGRTDIQIETDVIQTWLFDYQVKSSFVEREHVDDDGIGLHTVPEQLELGDYVCNSVNKHGSLSFRDMSVIIGSTVDLMGYSSDDWDPDNVGGDLYGGVYSGVKYYRANVTIVHIILSKLAKKGKSDAITCMFMAPYSMIPVESNTNGEALSEVESSTGARVIEWVNNTGDTENMKPSSLNGYNNVKNNKLFTYPYTYLLMSNNNGGSAVYKYELFNMDDLGDKVCQFKVHGVVTPGMSIRLIPQNYNGVESNNNEGLNSGKYPICGWTTDVYTNWLTQNAVNIGVSVGVSALAIGTGLVSGVGGGTMALVSAGGNRGLAMAGGLQNTASTVGAVGGGLAGIGSTVGEIYAHSLQPPQAEGNLNSGDVTYGSGNLTFTAYQMSIKKEYAEIIDDFFSMFGYKINRVKVPLKNHRANYWYTKTIDVNIDGPIPNDDLRKIKECYNKGITFWVNPNNIGNYTVNNTINVVG